MYGTNANFATSTDLSKLSDPSSCSWDDLITAPLVIESKKYLHQNHCQRYYLNVTSIGRGVLIPIATAAYLLFKWLGGFFQTYHRCSLLAICFGIRWWRSWTRGWYGLFCNTHALYSILESRWNQFCFLLGRLIGLANNLGYSYRMFVHDGRCLTLT